MSYEDIETSDYAGTPVELYLFRYGDGENSFFAYTNAETRLTITIPAEVLGPGAPERDVEFMPIPISRENYKASGKMENANMALTIPINTELARIFLDYPPTQQVYLVIYSGHLNDPTKDYPAVWSGRVLSTQREGYQAKLTCESAIASMRRPGLRRNWQYNCPYVLFGEGCHADQDRAAHKATVAAVNGNTIVLQAWLQPGDNHQSYTGGMIRWQTDHGKEYRTIQRVDPDGTIRFIGPVRHLEAGMEIDVIWGCNHQQSDCRNLHQNILNYGGQLWIPLKNPVKAQPYW